MCAMMMNMMGMGIVSMIVWILILGFLFYGVYLVITKIIEKSKDHPNASSGNHLQILKERLARGEIDAEEYKRLKETLEED